MSQRNIEILLGKILTDEDFRRAFFPVRAWSFAVAAAHGLELTLVERHALSTLRRRRFEFIAQSLDPRISRSASSSPPKDGEGEPERGGQLEDLHERNFS
jgi:hypothetical protein